MTDKKVEFWRAAKFLFFSVSAGVIQTVSFTLLNEFAHLDYWISHLASLVLSVLWNFTLNRKFTFKSANNIPIAMLKAAAFYVVFAPLSTWWTDVFTTKFHINEYLVLAFTMIVNFVGEYLYQRFIVFGKSLDTAKKE